MVMSGGGTGDPRDDPESGENIVLDYSFQNHSKGLLRKGRHKGSTF